MSFSSTAIALREALKRERTTGVDEAARFDVWGMMAVRYGCGKLDCDRVLNEIRQGPDTCSDGDAGARRPQRYARHRRPV
jgi:hypothetical protein